MARGPASREPAREACQQRQGERAMPADVRAVPGEAAVNPRRRRLAARSLADLLRQRHGELERARDRAAADGGRGRWCRARVPSRRAARADADWQPVAERGESLRQPGADVWREHGHRRVLLSWTMNRLAFTLPAVLALCVAGAAGAATPDHGLIVATKAGDAAAVRTLVQEKADVNAREPDGTTALHWAVRVGSGTIVDVLLSAGGRTKAGQMSGPTHTGA